MKTIIKIITITLFGITINGRAQNFDESDLRIGLNDGRPIGSKLSQRALVHWLNDELIINYNGDFEGGTKIISNLTVNGSISSGSNFKSNGADFVLGLNDGRPIGSKTSQRALVHGSNDELIINYNGDFEGGTKIISNLAVNGSISSGSNFKSNGADFVLGLNDGRTIGSKTSQRALVHGWNDDLIINYNGDFEGGTRIINDLAVLGKIESKEVKVTNTPTADFVFEENYNLPTLEFIDEHIRNKKHLPEIASAKEMKKNGVNVGEFQIQLLQKIEELTLYIIEQDKRIKLLETKLKKSHK